MKKYNNKYRDGTFRLQSWDYRSDGAYFITILTDGRKLFFGEIKNGIMNQNEIGELADKFWKEIPKYFPFVELGNYIVMPNHIHGVLIINRQWIDPDDKDNLINTDNSEMTKQDVPKLSRSENGGLNKKWKSGSIGVIINQYKRVVTINARKVNSSFGWQSRFNDHIIRSSISFDKIQDYIENNPKNWKED